MEPGFSYKFGHRLKLGETIIFRYKNKHLRGRVRAISLDGYRVIVEELNSDNTYDVDYDDIFIMGEDGERDVERT